MISAFVSELISPKIIFAGAEGIAVANFYENMAIGAMATLRNTFS